MRALATLILAMAILSVFAPLALAQALTPEAERTRRLRRAAERIEAARKLLAEAQGIAPELADEMARARDAIKDISDDTADIREQANAPWEFIKTAFPWAAPLIAAGGAYAGGRRHQASIERKRPSRSTGGGAEPGFPSIGAEKAGTRSASDSG